MRLEQLYPYPEWNIAKILDTYGRAREIFWVQEEPENMGAWRFLEPRFRRGSGLLRKIGYIGRPDSASPAAGSRAAHRQEQQTLITNAFE